MRAITAWREANSKAEEDKQQKENPTPSPPQRDDTRWDYKGSVWIEPYIKSKWHKWAAIARYTLRCWARTYWRGTGRGRRSRGPR